MVFDSKDLRDKIRDILKREDIVVDDKTIDIPIKEGFISYDPSQKMVEEF